VTFWHDMIRHVHKSRGQELSAPDQWSRATSGPQHAHMIKKAGRAGENNHGL
jgi:hypothetical protein